MHITAIGKRVNRQSWPLAWWTVTFTTAATENRICRWSMLALDSEHAISMFHRDWFGSGGQDARVLGCLHITEVGR
jgi:hypothetical protein